MVKICPPHPAVLFVMSLLSPIMLFAFAIVGFTTPWWTRITFFSNGRNTVHVYANGRYVNPVLEIDTVIDDKRFVLSYIFGILTIISYFVYGIFLVIHAPFLDKWLKPMKEKMGPVGKHHHYTLTVIALVSTLLIVISLAAFGVAMIDMNPEDLNAANPYRKWKGIQDNGFSIVKYGEGSGWTLFLVGGITQFIAIPMMYCHLLVKKIRKMRNGGEEPTNVNTKQQIVYVDEEEEEYHPPNSGRQPMQPHQLQRPQQQHQPQQQYQPPQQQHQPRPSPVPGRSPVPQGPMQGGPPRQPPGPPRQGPPGPGRQGPPGQGRPPGPPPRPY